MSVVNAQPTFDEWVADHEDECVEFLQDIISIPSATTVGEDEEKIAKRIEEEMITLGYDDVFIDGIGNVHGVIEGKRDEVVMFNSHIDTVGKGDIDQWEHDPYEGEVDDGAVYGLGASDMLCAMASMVYGGGALAASDEIPEHTVYVTGEVFEEVHEGVAMRYVDEETDIDLASVVIGEASEMNVKRGHRGRCELKIEIEGTSCHASAPERGVNPLYHASEILQRIEELNEETNDHDFLGKGTIAGTKLVTDTPSNNAVPAHATLYVDRRLTIGEDEDTVHAELKDAISAAEEQYGDDVNAEVETLSFDRPSWTGYQSETPKYYPTWMLEEDHPLVQNTYEVVDSVLDDRETEITKWTFSTSGNYTMGRADVPTIGFGPSWEKYAHMADEKVEVDNLIDACRVYAALGLEL